MGTESYRHANGGFEVVVPDGWQIEPDEENGLVLSTPEGCGLLHLMPFQRDEEEEVDPAEELYAFLADQEIELEEDEVDDLELPGEGSLALCEYVVEEEGEAIHWLMGVATAPGRLVFASYSCPDGDALGAAEREEARRILAGLRFG
jgi:hypothetical protein